MRGISPASAEIPHLGHFSLADFDYFFRDVCWCLFTFSEEFGAFYFAYLFDSSFD